MNELSWEECLKMFYTVGIELNQRSKYGQLYSTYPLCLWPPAAERKEKKGRDRKR